MSARFRSWDCDGSSCWLRAAKPWPLRGLLVCWVAFVLLGACVRAGDALGASGHAFVSGFSEAPLGAELLGPSALAVDHASGDVFVGDALSGYVDVYDPAGGFVASFGGGLIEPVGIAVDEANSEVFVADRFNDVVWVYASNGEGGFALRDAWTGAGVTGHAFGEVTGVAVDNSAGPAAGDIYVVEAETIGGEPGAIDVYTPAASSAMEAALLKRLSGGKPEEPNGIAVDQASGRVLVADSRKGAVLAYSPEGVFEEKLSGKGSPYGSFKSNEELGNVAGVGVDAATGDLYVAEAERGVVSQYSSTGVWQGWITSTPSGGLGEPAGVVLSGQGDVYVADRGAGMVNRFGPGVVVPDVVTGKAAKAKLTRTSAVLAGTINGDGKPASYRFQYGSTQGLGAETSGESSGSGEASVSVEVTGLDAGRIYYYRIVGENENGTNVGMVRSFETAPAVEGVETGPVKELEPEGATLTGMVNPGGLDTHYHFQWGTTNAYGNTTPAPPGTDVGSGTSAIEAEAVLTGLAANTLYHYRLVAENEEYGTTYGQDRTFTTPGPPTICTEPTTAIGQTEATIHACVNPDHLDTTYRFDYGETTSYGHEAPIGGQVIGTGSSPVAVSAVLTGLNVGVTYHFRVVAENEAGTRSGPDQTFTTTPTAPVDGMFVTKISDSEAVLHAQINPLGNDTRYYFQYGAESCQADPAGCASFPAPPGQDIGAGTTGVPGEAKLTGLQPGTTYHYRVIATNALGSTEGPERTFTTQQQHGSFVLPDNRAWELVTPPDKGAAPVEALTREGGVILSSIDGNAFTYIVDGALGENVEGNRSPEWQQVLAARASSGWTSQDVTTPSSKAKGLQPGNPPEYQFFNPDLSTTVVKPFEFRAVAEPPLVPGVTQATIYLRNNATGSYLPLVSEANTPAGTNFGEHVSFVSATPALSHIVIKSSVSLTGAGSAAGLYEWTDGQLQFISVLPHSLNAATSPGLGFFGRVMTNAISTDGSRVIWSTRTENGGRGRLYLRDTAKGETIRLDAAARGVTGTVEASAQYQAASSDGSRVFFTDKQRLTPDATAESGLVQETGKPDLYECEITEVSGEDVCELKDLTVDHNSGEHAAVQSLILGASENGSSVYLVAQGVLAGNGNGSGETAQPGKDNLYELNYGGTRWDTTFIATLSSGDAPEWEGNHIGDTAYLTARVSPNGRYLAFMSQAPITGYDNVDANPVAQGARDEEVFLYDSDTKALRCVSCNPSGARPAGVLDSRNSGEGLGLLVDRRKVWGEPGNEHWLAANIPGWTAQSLTFALFQSRYLSNDGRLYFNSPDSLVPAAKNGKEDVYEYEPSGVGSCQSQTGGCVSLISGGSSDRESAFIEATPNGSSVFFLTEAQLLPEQDTDSAFDIYDARECSEASPCLARPAAPARPCEETEECRPAQPAQPIPGSTGTAVFTGPGNAVGQTRPLGKQESKAKQESRAKTTARTRTRASRLRAALRACRAHHKHSRRKRAACERKAHRRYGTKHEYAKKKMATKSRLGRGRAGR